MVDKTGDGAIADDSARTEAPRPSETPTVGQTLQRARAALGLSLEQCATDLRIEQPQLAALESDKFERIGVPVFVKGYIRQYGQRLGLDPRDLIALYSKQQGNLREIEIQPSRTIKLRDERQLAGWVVAILVIAALAVFFGLWWFSDFQVGTFLTPPVTPAPTPAPADAPKAAAPEAAPAPVESPLQGEPAATPEATPQNAPAAPPAAAPPVAAAAAAPPVTQPLPAGLVVAAATPSTRPASSEPKPAAPVERQVAAPVPASSLAADVTLAFDQESWAEVVDARGQHLFSGNGTAGKSVVLRGEPPFAVVLGNADGVRVDFDGGPYPVPPESRTGKRARFTLDISEE
jgi:cytoskeleton protein RodZ